MKYYVFVALFYLLFVIFKIYSKRDEDIARKKALSLFSMCAFCAGAIIIRLLIAYNTKGFETDINCFKAWSIRAFEKGFSGFYDASGAFFSDYPPGYIYVLYVTGFINHIFRLGDAAFTLLVKLPAIICDIITFVLIYCFSVKENNKIAAYFAPLFVLFNPAIINNSSNFGQIDSVFTLFILLAFIGYRDGKKIKATVFYAIALLIKPQALLFAPVILLCAADGGERPDYKGLLKSLLVGFCLLILGILPFINELNLLEIVAGKYFGTMGSYNYYTINAANIYMFFGKNWEAVLGAGILNIILIFAIVALVYLFFLKSGGKGRLVYCGFLMVFALFMFSTKMHERYLYPAIMLCFLSYILIKDKRLLLVCAFLSSIHYINVSAVLYDGRITGVLSVVLPILHLALFYFVFIISFDYADVKRLKRSDAPKKFSLKLYKIDFMRIDAVLIASVVLVYSALAFYALGNKNAPESFYFPERAGEEIVIDFKKPRNITSVSIYAGTGNDKFDIMCDENGIYKTAFIYEQNSVFRWIKSDINKNTRYIKIVCDGAESSLGEIVFFENGEPISKNEITIVKGGETAQNIFDEQEFLPQMSNYINGTYFDEVYHARTAYEYLNGIYPYETTHPPLGKALISVGIAIFGMNPFGWRVVPVLFGIFLLPLIYLFARKLFPGRKPAFLAMVLLSLDFMHFSQSRMGTIDVFVTFFVLAAYFFMICYINSDKHKWLYLFLSGICFGLGASVKWNFLYSGIGLAVIYFVYFLYNICKKPKAEKTGMLAETVLKGILCFVLVPCAIYVLSYFPMYRFAKDGGILKLIFDNQKQMLTYHSSLTATHPYESSVFQWVFNLRPVWYSYAELGNNKISTIAGFGNPVVWWSGIVAILYAVYSFVKNKNLVAGVLLAGYFSQLLPWFFIERSKFAYHYFPLTVFLILMIAFMAFNLSSCRKYVYYGIIIMSGICFVMFFPVISGVAVSNSYVLNVLTWFKSWVFSLG